MKLRLCDKIGPDNLFTFNTDAVRLGRDPQCELPFDSQKYTKVSALHAEIQLVGGRYQLIHRSRSNRTLLNESPVETATLLKVGDVIRLGFTGPRIEVVSLSDDKKQPSDGLARQRASTEPPPTLLAAKATDFIPKSSVVNRISIGKGGIIGRDAQKVDFVLNHPQVSRIHARLVVSNRGVLLSDLGSANGTFCNGQRITTAHRLELGDTIDIGPFGLYFDGLSLSSRTRADNSQLVAANVHYTVQDRESRKPLKLLDGVSFVLDPGEFLCLLGPSGSGKSTLLNVISGRRRSSDGSVFLNARDLHANFAALKQDIAVVPQITLLHESLTVEQTFYYTSQLRLPPDLSEFEIAQNVDRILAIVGLSHRRNVQINQLSGGQLKRAGLGCELISDPSLLFLDEVTSGLDEHSDGEIMALFQQLAENGKSLVCITHNLTHVERCCDLVAILTVGGRLAFFGSPLEAKRYFNVVSLADIYVELEARSPAQWADDFVKSTFYKRYVVDRRPELGKEVDHKKNGLNTNPLPAVIRQFSVLARRNFSIWLSNIPALAALFGQALLVAFLLCLVFGSIDDLDANIPLGRATAIRNLLFLLNVSCFWLGCNNAVKEIVKERRIYEREKAYNLLPEAYLASKFLLLSVIGMLQAVLLGCIAMFWFDLPGDRASILSLLIAQSFIGTALGLTLSANSKSEEVAVALVPVAIIPQIILAGVVASLPTTANWIAKIGVTVYWGQRATESLVSEADRIGTDEISLLKIFAILTVHSIVLVGFGWFGVRFRKMT